jgi:hypothetical protein
MKPMEAADQAKGTHKLPPTLLNNLLAHEVIVVVVHEIYTRYFLNLKWSLNFILELLC